MTKPVQRFLRIGFKKIKETEGLPEEEKKVISEELSKSPDTEKLGITDIATAIGSEYLVVFKKDKNQLKLDRITESSTEKQLEAQMPECEGFLTETLPKTNGGAFYVNGNDKVIYDSRTLDRKPLKISDLIGCVGIVIEVRNGSHILAAATHLLDTNFDPIQPLDSVSCGVIEDMCKLLNISPGSVGAGGVVMKLVTSSEVQKTKLCTKVQEYIVKAGGQATVAAFASTVYYYVQ